MKNGERIAEILEARRKQKKISKTKLAELTGIHVNTLYRVLNDGKLESVEMFFKLAKALGVGVQLYEIK